LNLKSLTFSIISFEIQVLHDCTSLMSCYLPIIKVTRTLFREVNDIDCFWHEWSKIETAAQLNLWSGKSWFGSCRLYICISLSPSWLALVNKSLYCAQLTYFVWEKILAIKCWKCSFCHSSFLLFLSCIFYCSINYFNLTQIQNWFCWNVSCS
jgi:hypothetical protein